MTKASWIGKARDGPATAAIGRGRTGGEGARR